MIKNISPNYFKTLPKNSLNKVGKNLLTDFSGWYFLAIFGFVCPFLSLFLNQPWFSVGLIWWGLKLLILQKKSVSFICGFFLLLGVILGISYRQYEEKQEKLWQVGATSGVLIVDPLAYQQDDTYFWGTGKFTTKNGEQKVRFSFPKFLETVPVGSTLTLAVTGELSLPKEQENFGGFHEKAYLKQQGIFKKLTISKLHHLKTSFPLQNGLKQATAYFKKVLQTRLPESLSSFYQGTFLGVKDEFFYETAGVFSKSGLWLFFSFSGLQFFFLLEGVKLLFLRLGVTQETTKILGILVGLLLLATLGFRGNLFRGLLFSSLKILPKQYFSGLDRFSLTLFCGQLLFPYQFLTFAGQMSYLVTFLWCCPLVKNRRLQRFVLPFFLAPLFWWHLFEWSYLSFLTFLFFVPLMKKGLLMSLGMLLPLLLSSQLAQITGQVYEAGLLFLEKTLPFSVIVGRPPVGVLLIFYGGILGSFFYFSKTSAKKFLIPLPFLFLWGLNWSYFSPVGEITFVNVRQGDSILLKSPFQKEVYLIDTGGRLAFSGLKGPSIASQTLLPYLKFRGIKKIQQIFVSHGDADHMGDLLEVVKTIPTEKIYLQKGATQQPLVLETLKQLPVGTTPYPLATGTAFPFAKGQLTFLGPEVGSGSNEDSLHLLLEIFQKTFLFAGDAEKIGERNFLQTYPNLTVDVLKISHHGSKTSTQALLLEQLKPTYGVISCGVDNAYGHPAEEVLDRLAEAQVKIFRTDFHGTISFNFQPQGFKTIKTLVTTEKK